MQRGGGGFCLLVRRSPAISHRIILWSQNFFHKHPKYKVVKSFFYYLGRFLEIQPRLSRDFDFLGVKIFSIFFITKSHNFMSNLNDDCPQLSFEVYNLCVAQKLRISEFFIDFSFAWTLATSANSRGRNFNRASNFS